jgi:FkbM family methyltransferase
MHKLTGTFGTGYRRDNESDVMVTYAASRVPLHSLPLPVTPEILAPLRMRDHTGVDAYTLFVGKERNDYEKWVAEVGQTSDIGEMCHALLRGKGTLIDLGAALGWVSVAIAVTGSQVIAIEMNPTNCLRLNQAIRANHLANMMLAQTAVSDFDGLLHFHGDAAWGHVSHAPGGKEVLCQRVDSVMYGIEMTRSLPSPVVMKIDVERHEHAVFAGSAEFIRKHRPVILFETIEIEGDATDAGHSKAAKQTISDMGYELFELSDKVLAPKRVSDPQDGHVSDFLAVPTEKLASLADLPYEVRPLTDAEILARFSVDANGHVKEQHLHVEGLLAYWREKNPALASRATDLAVDPATSH